MATATIEIDTKPCFMCSKAGKVTVDLEGYELYNAGVLIQDAFPDLSDDVREMLITGTHPECWDAMFPDEDETSDEDEDGFYNPSSVKK